MHNTIYLNLVDGVIFSKKINRTYSPRGDACIFSVGTLHTPLQPFLHDPHDRTVQCDHREKVYRAGTDALHFFT